MMDLLDVTGSDPRGQRLDALTLPRHKKATHVDRRPLAPNLVSEGHQERLKPLVEAPLDGGRQGEIAHRAPLWSALPPEWKEESGGVVLGDPA